METIKELFELYLKSSKTKRIEMDLMLAERKLSFDDLLFLYEQSRYYEIQKNLKMKII